MRGLATKSTRSDTPGLTRDCASICRGAPSTRRCSISIRSTRLVELGARGQRRSHKRKRSQRQDIVGDARLLAPWHGPPECPTPARQSQPRPGPSPGARALLNGNGFRLAGAALGRRQRGSRPQQPGGQPWSRRRKASGRAPQARPGRRHVRLDLAQRRSWG